MLPDLLFFMFASVLLLGGVGVVAARNPMYCVLCLILSFVNAAGLFMLLGAEFLSLLIIMVYVGAIAVMFLFVVMTVDIDFAVLKEGFASYLPVGLLMALVLALELGAAAWAGLFTGFSSTASLPVDTSVTNIEAIGMVLFTNYILPFQGAALILLIAMVGAIVLAHRTRDGVKRQDITKQLQRGRKEGLVMTSPKSGAGVGKPHWQPNKVEK